MDSIRTFELKVGIFILIGIAILFIIVFSMGDLNLSKAGYNIKIQFSFANGLGPGAPVRLAGVGVGEIAGIRLIYDEAGKKTKAEVTAWIQQDAKIEEDAMITINTLGLLGEKYLEIYPGTPGTPIAKAGSVLIGKDPVAMEKVTDNLAAITNSFRDIAERLQKGEGTIGKMLTDDKLYNDLVIFIENGKGIAEKLNKGEGTFGKLITEDKIYKDLSSFMDGAAVVGQKLKNGEGTIGKLFTDDTMYNNLEEFTADIKKHPWKLLSGPRN